MGRDPWTPEPGERGTPWYHPLTRRWHHGPECRVISRQRALDLGADPKQADQVLQELEERSPRESRAQLPDPRQELEGTDPGQGSPDPAPSEPATADFSTPEGVGDVHPGPGADEEAGGAPGSFRHEDVDPELFAPEPEAGAPTGNGDAPPGHDADPGAAPGGNQVPGPDDLERGTPLRLRRDFWTEERAGKLTIPPVNHLFRATDRKELQPDERELWAWGWAEVLRDLSEEVKMVASPWTVIVVAFLVIFAPRYIPGASAAMIVEGPGEGEAGDRRESGRGDTNRVSPTSAEPSPGTDGRGEPSTSWGAFSRMTEGIPQA